MARTHVITGSASGLGKATAERLKAKGHRVIGVDLQDADIIADLGTKSGRVTMLEQVKAKAPDGIDGILAGAGIAAFDREADTMAINFFGAVATLEGLRPMLRGKGGRAVAICSTAATLPSDDEIVAMCLDDAEEQVLARAAQGNSFAYGASKRALALWLRRAAIRPEWAGQGRMLNGIAPGVVYTPLTVPLFASPELMETVGKSNPIAVDDFGQPEEIAEMLDFLLNFEGRYTLGQIYFIDGGTEAILRPGQV
jgi:NAD(P)-dependent dehydrogenase (short-subunit alcohol dehydrogenase family)